MNAAELNSRLEFLTNELKRKNKKYAELEDEIQGLELDRDALEGEIESLEKEIGKVRESLAESELKGLGDVSDPFLNDFIRASCFADREGSYRPIFGCVMISDSTLFATDTKKLVVIKNDHIPDELKGKAVKWFARGNFAEHVVETDGFPSYEAIVKGAIDGHVFKDMLKASEFNGRYNVRVMAQDVSGYIVEVELPGLVLNFNKNNLEQALMALGEQEAYLYAKDWKAPILMQSDKMTVAVMPLKMG